MNKNFQYYKNKGANICVTIPSREEVKLYLLYNNYLSEYSTLEELELVLYNLGIAQKLEILKGLIDAKVIEVGGVPWDIIPTEGNTEHVLSSDAIFNIIQNYYTKQLVDQLLEDFWTRLLSVNSSITIVVDSHLSSTSANPVLNKIVKEALDSKVELEELEELVTNIVHSIAQELQPKDSKSKGYYSSYNELVSNNPNSSIGDWAIIDLNGIWYIAKYTENGWLVTLQTYDNNVDLNGYVKREELESLQEKLISGVNIKKINGESILGSGNIEILGGGGVSKEEIENILYPLSASISASPSSFENTGELRTVTLTIGAKKKNTITPDLMKLNGQEINITTSYLVHISSNTTYNLYVEYGEESAIASTKINFIDPWYVGFDGDIPQINHLLKVVSSSLKTTKELVNSVEGNYLWIIVPGNKVPKVSTDAGGTYVVELSLNKTEGNYRYYRSVLPITISTINYYIYE